VYSLILAAMVLTAEPAKLAVKLETLELPKDLATAIREACSPDAVHVTEKAGALCLIWLRKDIPTKDGKVVPGTLIGAIQLHRSWSDFKTQEAPAGIYTLRYVLQPISKDHEGTAPQRDFVILVPAVEDPNPVLYFEHKALYRRLKGSVPDGYYTTPIGVARRLKEGDQVTIISYGLGVHWALEVLEQHPGIRATLLDLRTLLPLDIEGIVAAVKHTGKALVLHEDTLTGGIGAEVASLIAQHCFEYLDGPVVRCGSLDTPVPFAKELEHDFLAKARFEEQLLQLVQY